MIGQFIRRVTGQGGTLTLDDPTGLAQQRPAAVRRKGNAGDEAAGGERLH